MTGQKSSVWLVQPRKLWERLVVLSTSAVTSKVSLERTRFEFLAQKMDGLRSKKPKTMNLYGVGWKNWALMSFNESDNH